MSETAVASSGISVVAHLSKEQIVNREHWLQRAGSVIVPHIENIAQEKINPFHISVGFPSRNALSTKRRVIGQCWNGLAAADHRPQLFISPMIAERNVVLATVAHELCHILRKGHGKDFGRLARGIFLGGKLTATVATDEFMALIEPAILKLGPYPHAVLDAGGRVPQKTNLIKISCSCGVILRGTKKAWEQWSKDGKKVPSCGCGKKFKFEIAGGKRK
jgi:hypothetical protein